jgi:DNA-binding CsgD family transcriptional regulator
VILSGTAGVGKTRLAREVVAAAAADGYATEWIQATQAAASIPLGAVVGLAPAGAQAEGRLHLFQVCVGALRERALERPLVLGVDDAHLLDASSAALVLQMAQTRTAFVVVTVRAGERCPDAIVALWKDLETPRLELQQLSADETAELLEAALGGELTPEVRRWAYASSEGHVLYLRELVQGALARMALVREGDMWRLRGHPQASPALVELISRRLDDLGDEQLEAARMIAFGEPVDLDTVVLLAGSAALSELEGRGLVVVTRSAAPSGVHQVRLGHSLYGEVLREQTPIVRGMQLRLRLAEAVRAKGLHQPGDALRVATWLTDAGADLDEPLLLAAASEANAAGDLELAERLVLRASSGAEAALILASTYSRQRRFAEAEALLAEWESALPRGLAVAYLEARAVEVLHLGLRRTGDALALLDRAQQWFADPEWRDQVWLIRGRLALLAGPADRPADALEGIERLLGRSDLANGVSRRASISHAWNLSDVGRSGEALALSARLRPSLPLRDWDDSMALVVWLVTRLEAGYEWDAVERWLAEADRISAGGTDHLTRGEVVTALAIAALHRGQPVTAARRAREAIEILERSDLVRRLPLAWLALAWSAAMRGDAEAARAALAGYMEAAGGARIPRYRRQEIIARAALTTLEGERGRAVAMLLDGAANEHDILIRAHLLHEAVRSGAEPRLVAPSLREVAVAASEAPLVRAFTMVVDARLTGDGAALLAAADAFGEIGAWLWAAESAAWAAEASREAGRDDSARRAMALSGDLYAKCEDAWSPVLTTMELAAAELTERELEVTNLAARGASNAEIAERLVLSVRTVESHLYRAMRKLGVSTREELGAR